MSKQMVMSVMSKDRPGIVADITGVIYQLQGDLADLNQSVLCDYFTMILIATFADSVTPEDVIAGFSHIQSETKLEVVVKEMESPMEVAPAPSGAPTTLGHPRPSTAKAKRAKEIYILTAQGKNKSGLVHRIGLFCYQHGINILDLATTLSGDQYTMILQLDLSGVESVTTKEGLISEEPGAQGMDVPVPLAPGMDEERLAGTMDAIRTSLTDYAQEAGLSVVLQHEDIFKATSEISLF